MRRAISILVLLALLASGAATSLANGPEPPTCLGFTVPQWQAMGYQVRVGTAGNDTINAPWQKTVIMGLEGNDRLNGAGNDDIICGGPGDDTITGGGGINFLEGGDGNDGITGGPKRDEVAGGQLVDGGPAAVPAITPRPAGWAEGIAPHEPPNWGGRLYLLGRVWDCAPGDGDDIIREQAGGGGEEVNVAPHILGCGGNDTIYGGDGDEEIDGGEGDDTLYGDPGNDWLTGGPGIDFCDGGYSQNSTHPTQPIWQTHDAADGTCETIVAVETIHP